MGENYPFEVRTPAQGKRLVNALLLPAANISFQADFMSATSLETGDIHYVQTDEESHWSEKNFSAIKSAAGPEPDVAFMVSEVVSRPTHASEFMVETEFDQFVETREYSISTEDYTPLRVVRYALMSFGEKIESTDSDIEAALAAKKQSDTDIDGSETDQLNVFDEHDVKRIVKILGFLRLIKHGASNKQQ